MLIVKITYRTKQNQVRCYTVVRDSIKEALRYFKFRYGHKVLNVETV